MLRDEFVKEQGIGKGERYNSGFYYAMPRDPADYNFFLDVERETKMLARTRFGVMGMDSEWQIFTVAYVVLDACCEALAQQCKENFGKRVSFAFYDMLNIGCSNRVNITAEKVGSINCFFQPGVALDAIADDPEKFWKREKRSSREIFLPSQPGEGFEWDLPMLETIARNARVVLGTKHKLTILDQYAGCEMAITYTFLAVAYAKLINAVVNRENKEETRVGFRFMTLFRLFGRDNDGVISIEILPDATSKRTAKSDRTTDVVALDIAREEEE